MGTLIPEVFQNMILVPKTKKFLSKPLWIQQTQHIVWQINTLHYKNKYNTLPIVVIWRSFLLSVIVQAIYFKSWYIHKVLLPFNTLAIPSFVLIKCSLELLYHCFITVSGVIYSTHNYS